MLNGGSVSWCSKCQPTLALSSRVAKYIALIPEAKEPTWLRLLLSKLRLLKTEYQYAKINAIERNSSIQALKKEIRAEMREETRRFPQAQKAKTLLLALAMPLSLLSSKNQPIQSK